MNFVPILSPQIDWDYFLRGTQSILNRSVTAELDKKGDFLYDYKSFISCVNEFRNPGSKEIHSAARHLVFSFIVPGDQMLFGELYDAGLTVSVEFNWKAAIVTGSLQQWYRAILNGCEEKKSERIRKICNEFLLFFENIGVGFLFQNYKKIDHPDKTFLLGAK